jgi:hypothetical protein
MYRYYLVENSPRDRIKKVEEQLPAVKWATAWVVADTVGGDRAAIFDAWMREARGKETGLHPRDFFPDDDKVHKNEKLIRWVAEKISPEAYEVSERRKTFEQFLGSCAKLEGALPQIAYWVEKTKPNLFQLSALQAIGLASEMEVEDDFPVPQGEVIYRFPDGWTVQELKTPEQVYAEGEVMQHCMRESADGPRFCKQISRGDTRLFSLRNPQGRPGVSIQYDTEKKRFVQIFAKQNVSLGSSLQQLRHEEREDEDGTRRKRHKDPEGLWRGIQKYKPYIRRFIIDKFDADASGLVMADAPLPDGLKSVKGSLYLRDYNHPLPAGLKSVNGALYLLDYNHPLPAGLKSVGGYLLLGGYSHPLPAGLTSVGSDISLTNYDHPLPAGLTSVGGSLWLGGYNHPLPDGLKIVAGNLSLDDYHYPLPAGLTSVGGSLWLGGRLYNHPLPAGLRVKGAVVGAERYPYEIPGRRPALKPNRRRTSRPSKSRRKTSRSKRKTSRS